MSSETVLILLLVGLPLAMMFMRRGGAGGMAGGCCGGHRHGHGHEDGTQDESSPPDDRQPEQPLPVGEPGQQSKPTEPSVPARS